MHEFLWHVLGLCRSESKNANSIRIRFAVFLFVNYIARLMMMVFFALAVLASFYIGYAVISQFELLSGVLMSVISAIADVASAEPGNLIVAAVTTAGFVATHCLAMRAWRNQERSKYKVQLSERHSELAIEICDTLRCLLVDYTTVEFVGRLFEQQDANRHFIEFYLTNNFDKINLQDKNATKLLELSLKYTNIACLNINLFAATGLYGILENARLRLERMAHAVYGLKFAITPALSFEDQFKAAVNLPEILKIKSEIDEIVRLMYTSNQILANKLMNDIAGGPGLIGIIYAVRHADKLVKTINEWR